MRISTNMLYANSAGSLSDLSEGIYKINEQLAANTRLLTPSEDPVASARVLEIQQQQSINEQLTANRTQAENALNLEESSLSQLTTLIQNAQTLAVEAGNAIYSDSELAYLAEELRGTLDEMLRVANTTDSAGSYIYSGYKTQTEPFSLTDTGAVYSGDQGERIVQVDTSRKISLGDSGSAVFQNSVGLATAEISIDSGTYNTGEVSGLNIVDEAAVTGDAYEISFSVDASGLTSYTVINQTSGTVIDSDTYEEPQAISFGGVELVIDGERQDGDKLTVQTARPSTNQDLFTTVLNMISALEGGNEGAVNNANYTEAIAVANANLSSALDNVLTVRASVGARLNEIETLDTMGVDTELRYAEELSDLQDIDYYEAISELSAQQTVLEAAQQTYITMTSVSLFDYL